MSNDANFLTVYPGAAIPLNARKKISLKKKCVVGVEDWPTTSTWIHLLL
jgi:hypothetical protein